MPTIDTQIDRTKAKLCAGLAPDKIEKIGIYLEGLKCKFWEAEYALSKIRELATINQRTTATSPQEHYADESHLRFYVDSFFAFLYSTLDVMAQVLDKRYSLINDEQGVKFKRMVEKLAQGPPYAGTAVECKCTALKNNRTFIELEKYRNCSTHRRHIYIELPTRRGSRGYPEAPAHWLICDDPYSLAPTLRKNRKLIDYCEKTHKKMRDAVLKILRSV